MKVSNMEIPDEIVAEIKAKAKTEMLFRFFYDWLSIEWGFLMRNRYVRKALESREKANPGCKVAIRLEYHSDVFEMSNDGESDIVVYVSAEELRRDQRRLLEHIREAYKVSVARYYPVFHCEDSTVDFLFEQSLNLGKLVEDLTDIAPDADVKLLPDGTLRFKIIQ